MSERKPRHSTRKVKPPARFLGWYGLRMVNAARDKAITDHRSCHTVAQLVSTSPITALPEHVETVKDAIDYSEHPVISHPTAAVTESTVVDVHVDPVVSHLTAAVTGSTVTESTVVDVHVDPVVSHPNAAVTGAVVENVEIIDDNSQSSVEVFSALMTFLDMAAVRMQPKKLIAWSDSCDSPLITGKNPCTFNAIPDTNHNANPTNPNRYSG